MIGEERVGKEKVQGSEARRELKKNYRQNILWKNLIFQQNTVHL